MRDPQASNDGIIIVGGFVGELIISFTCLLDYILASPQNQNFQFSVDQVEQYLVDLFTSEENQLPDRAVVIHLAKQLSEIASHEVTDSEEAALITRQPQNMDDFGLRFLFEIQKDLVLSPDVIEVLYKAICKLAMRPPKELVAIPEVTDDMDAAKKDEVNEQIEQAKADNEVIEKDNQKVEAIKKKVLIECRGEGVYNPENEKALIKISNFREATLDASGNPVQSARTGNSNVEGQADTSIEQSEQAFSAEKLPLKIPLVKPINENGLQVAVYHNEAPYGLRRFLMEQARKSFKELEKADTTALLNHSSTR